MIDLKYTKAELREERGEGAVGPGGQPDPYPWGLSITLDEHTLQKLGLYDPLPQVGGEVHMTVVCKVTSVQQRADADGSDCRVGLQITMAEVQLVESADDEKGEKETPAAEAAEVKAPRKNGVMGY